MFCFIFRFLETLKNSPVYIESIFLRVSLCRVQSVTFSFCVFQIYVVIRTTTVTRTTSTPTAIQTQGKCPVSPKKKSFRINHPANEQHSKEFVLFMISLLRCFYRVFFFSYCSTTNSSGLLLYYIVMFLCLPCKKRLFLK